MVKTHPPPRHPLPSMFPRALDNSLRLTVNRNHLFPKQIPLVWCKHSICIHIYMFRVLPFLLYNPELIFLQININQTVALLNTARFSNGKDGREVTVSEAWAHTSLPLQSGHMLHHTMSTNGPSPSLTWLGLLPCWTFLLPCPDCPLKSEEERKKSFQPFQPLQRDLKYVYRTKCFISPLNFNGSHSFVGKITLVVNLNRLTDELQTQVEVLFPLKL